MACLNLANGNFQSVQFNTNDTNVGNVTITREPNSILVEHASYPNGLFLNGDFRSAVFGGGNFVALLRIEAGPPQARRVSIVDFTVAGNTPGAERNSCSEFGP
jgi:hypothetical protein